MSVDKEAFEEQVIADMRDHGGVISSGPMAGTRLLVLTTTGAPARLPAARPGTCGLVYHRMHASH
jgi:hypothetical protein